MSFMSAIGADPDEFHRVDFHTCHEALLLEYEHALTRIDSRTGTPYDVSGHFVWIGERTNALDGAHVELLSRVRNPIGVKVGPTLDARRPDRPGRPAQPRQRAGAAHASSPGWAPAGSATRCPR